MALNTSPEKASKTLFGDYASKLSGILLSFDWFPVEKLAQAMLEAKKSGRRIYLCGNGGSAGNAMHLANDFIYGASPDGVGYRVTALPANSSVLTCLANDISYDEVFAQQIKVLAEPGDILICLSGSGNSKNIVQALKAARAMDVQSFSILGFTGGEALKLSDTPIYFPVHDMQIAEDLQLVVGHMVMRYLSGSQG